VLDGSADAARAELRPAPRAALDALVEVRDYVARKDCLFEPLKNQRPCFLEARRRHRPRSRVVRLRSRAAAPCARAAKPTTDDDGAAAQRHLSLSESMSPHTAPRVPRCCCCMLARSLVGVGWRAPCALARCLLTHVEGKLLRLRDLSALAFELRALARLDDDADALRALEYFGEVRRWRRCLSRAPLDCAWERGGTLHTRLLGQGGHFAHSCASLDGPRARQKVAHGR
jgi:hypothetical protein